MNKQRQHRRIWTQQEDETLRNLIGQSADPQKPKWKQISEQLNKMLNLQFQRNPKQCRQRWYNSLAPSSQQSKEWGVEDDIKLIQACKQHGHRWSRLVKEFDQSVNDNRLKNHFYSTVRKIVRIINTIVKQSKRQYQQALKNNNLNSFPEQYGEIMKDIMKLRSFQPKLLSKVFSLIDEKQQYRYQAKYSLEVEQVKVLNDQILDYMQDYVSCANQFSNLRILKMIKQIMRVNRTIKTKYVREVKLSVQDQDQINKAQQIKKKRQKKINNIVKSQLQNKIIPDRKTKAQIISKIKDQNKRLKRLISPIEKKKLKDRKKEENKYSSYQEISQAADQDQGQENYQQMESQSAQQQKQFKSKSRLQLQDQQDQQLSNQKLKQEQEDQVGCMLNLSGNPNMGENNLYNQLGMSKSNLLNSSNQGRQRQKLQSPSFNFSLNFNHNNSYYGFNNNVSFTFNQPDKQLQNKAFEENINKSQKLNIQQEDNRIFKQKQEQKLMEKRSQKGKQNNRINQNPFASNFLNTIPLFTSNQPQKKKQAPQDFRQLINPYFPEHKLTHSQGYFTFDPPQVQNIAQQENELSRSNPIINSLNYLQFQNHKGNFDNGFMQAESGSSKLKQSKMFQGLFASANYSSNNDKGSEQSQKMKNSLFDLIPNFHPMHTSAFCPLFSQNIGDENRPIEQSRPLSTHFNDHLGVRINMMDSQPIGMYKSSDLHPDSNPSGASLYHSYSYGNMSQQNKSNQSRKKI